jgi:hypothetical protein
LFLSNHDTTAALGQSLAVRQSLTPLSHQPAAAPGRGIELRRRPLLHPRQDVLIDVHALRTTRSFALGSSSTLPSPRPRRFRLLTTLLLGCGHRLVHQERQQRRLLVAELQLHRLYHVPLLVVLPRLGVWQVGVRFGYLDLNDKAIQGGRVYDWSVGLNWFLNPSMKVQFNFILLLALRVLLVGVICHLSTEIGSSHKFRPPYISPLWPTGAVLFSVLVVTPVRHWWAYTLAAYFTSVVNDARAGFPVSAMGGRRSGGRATVVPCYSTGPVRI